MTWKDLLPEGDVVSWGYITLFALTVSFLIYIGVTYG